MSSKIRPACVGTIVGTFVLALTFSGTYLVGRAYAELYTGCCIPEENPWPFCPRCEENTYRCQLGGAYGYGVCNGSPSPSGTCSQVDAACTTKFDCDTGEQIGSCGTTAKTCLDICTPGG